jgi:hypothetical protein
LGHEPTPELYVKHLVLIGKEIKRVLRDDGTFWLNLGDSYWGSGNSSGHTSETKNLGRNTFDYGAVPRYSLSQKKHSYLKPKDLCMIPFEVARALQKDGWYLRRDIIWCLSGGTHLYVKTQKGIGVSTIKDLYRLKPETVELWNGEKWTKLLGVSKSKRTGEEIELVLRSGERIGCTKSHQWTTNRGLLKAGEIKKGDCLVNTILPSPQISSDTTILNEAVAYFIGLYLAEGSRSGDTIQISGHKDEISRVDRLRKIIFPYGGSLTYTEKGNKLDIRIYGKIINSLIDTFISGKTAKDKCLNPVCWRYSNNFLYNILMGYLEGNGSFDEKNNRYRLGFARNYNLERDLRVLAARLGFSLTLHPKFSKYQNGKRPAFKGEIRFEISGHLNNRNRNEIIEIRKSRAREFYDIGVKDEPHLFALASGILSHNSKPNPMPESVLDRPSTSHEYIFMFSKSRKYFYDSYAVRENIASNFSDAKKMIEQQDRIGGKTLDNDDKANKANKATNIGKKRGVGNIFLGRNKRSVWEVSSVPFSGAHFACVDEATEILTKEGWKNYLTIKLEDEIATLNIADETIHYHRPYSINYYNYEGEMIRIKNQWIDQLVTPNHRVLLKYLHHQKNNYKRLEDDNWNYINAENIKPHSGILIPNAGEYKGIYSIGKEKAELLGWIIAEGSIRNTTVRIYQSLSANPKKVERIRYLLKTTKQLFKEKSRERIYNGKLSKEICFSLNKTENNNSWIFEWIDKNKKPKWKLLHLVYDELFCLLNGLIDGDGHRRADGRLSFVQKGEDMHIWFRVLATHLGLRTTFSKSSRIYPQNTTQVTQQLYSQIHQSDFNGCYRREKYKGVVWCPSVANTNFIAKRNNKIYITGNTFPPKLIEPIIKAGTSEAGCCASCGKPYSRIVEKIKLVDDRAESDTKYDTKNDNAGRLATYRQGLRKGKIRGNGELYESKYFEEHGQDVQGFIRSQTQVSERDKSREIAEQIYPGDLIEQQKFINYVHDHGLSFNIRTVGWKKECKCKTEATLPAIVFDPFFGSGTTGMVAYDLGRDYLGIELQNDYKDIQKQRLGDRFNQLRLL